MSQQNENVIQCPSCSGTGYEWCTNIRYKEGHDGPKEMKITCTRCDGACQVPKEMLVWIENGKKLKAKRIDQGKNILQVAQEWMTTPHFVVMCEWGQIDNSRFVAADGISQ